MVLSNIANARGCSDAWCFWVGPSFFLTLSTILFLGLPNMLAQLLPHAGALHPLLADRPTVVVIFLKIRGVKVEGAFGAENIIDFSDGAVCLINLEPLVCHHQFPPLVCPAKILSRYSSHSEVGEETRTLFYCKPSQLVHAAQPLLKPSYCGWCRQQVNLSAFQAKFQTWLIEYDHELHYPGFCPRSLLMAGRELCCWLGSPWLRSLDNIDSD